MITIKLASAIIIISLAVISSSYGQEIKNIPSDPFSEGWFGYSTAISDDHLVVGAVKDSSEKGSIYIFYRDSGGTDQWGFQQKIHNSSSGRFGVDVDIDGNYIVAGAETENSGQGAAYVYFFNGSIWVAHDTLTASDAADDENFGISVGISGDYLIVGAYRDTTDMVDTASIGSAYIFHRSGNSWSEEDKLFESGERDLTPPDTLIEAYGFAVDIDGNYAVVGAPNTSDTFGGAHGALFMYMRSGVNWNLQTRVKPSVAGVAELGRSVAIYDTTAIGGAPLNDEDFNNNVGAVYVFTRNGSTWSQEQRILASDYAGEDGLGTSVALYNHYIIAGAPNESNYQGATYSFLRENGIWTEKAKTQASDGVGGGFSSGDQFGRAVAIDFDYAAVGSYLSDHTSTTNPGAVYLYTTTSDLALPVELLLFYAKFIDQKIELKWSTASEIDNIGFELFRSDQKESGYQLISSYKSNDELLGQINSSVGFNYSFVDEDIQKGKSYWYKLVDVSISGIRTETSPINVIADNTPNSFNLVKVYPNPFNPKTTIKIENIGFSALSESAELVLYNSLGQKIKSIYKGSLKQGSNTFNLDMKTSLHSIASGTYYLVLRNITRNKVKTIKLMYLK